MNNLLFSFFNAKGDIQEPDLSLRRKLSKFKTQDHGIFS